MASSTAPSMTLRPVAPDDGEFLYAVYACTRESELAQVPWDEAQREAFLKMQLNARDQSYRMHYPDIDDRIILFKDQRVGRLIVVRTDQEIRLADITVLPEYRRAGLGASLIKVLMAEADRSSKPIRLQVEQPNHQARRLYERLGFRVVGDNLTHVQMEYRPGSVLAE